METRAPFLSCSSPPAVYPSPTEDRPSREPVFMQIALTDGYGRTEHDHLPELRIPHVHRNHLAILPMKASVYVGSVHWEIF